MLGAYGLDVQNKQVWAVIDHNSDFVAAKNGVFRHPRACGVGSRPLGPGRLRDVDAPAEKRPLEGESAG
jgi:hypothetical protein